MGGVNEISISFPNGEEGSDVINTSIQLVKDLENKYSRYLPDSILSRCNRNSGVEPVFVDGETISLIEYADRCFDQSNGLFDITSGVLRKVWDFKKKTLPISNEIEKIKKLIGWSKVVRTKDSIFLPVQGMEIDLGGVVKEYASDRVAHELKLSGVKHALVNLGGDIHAIGPREDGTPWRVGITNPRNVKKTIASFPLLQGALATSGDYERFFEHAGKRYCHILNPKTGWPVNEFQSVTVCATSCLVAGSLSTIAMLLGKKKGLELLNDSGFPFLAITAEGKCFVKGEFVF